MTATLPEELQLCEPPVRNRRQYLAYRGQPPLVRHTALGDRLRDLRTQAGHTQAEMAILIGYRKGGSGRVSDWERGYHLPTLPLLHRYASALNMTVAQLLWGVL